jgi:tetratricopeptide (TPR) repeat protein
MHQPQIAQYPNLQNSSFSEVIFLETVTSLGGFNFVEKHFAEFASLFSERGYKLVSIKQKLNAWQGNDDIERLMAYHYPLLYSTGIALNKNVNADTATVELLSSLLLNFYNINRPRFSGFMLFHGKEIVLIDLLCFDQSCINEIDNLLNEQFNSFLPYDYDEDYAIGTSPSDKDSIAKYEKKHGDSASIADELFPLEAHQLAYEIMERVNQLKRNGFEKLLIESLSQALFNKTKNIDAVGTGLSTIRITNDYRIFLAEYGEHEIELTPLPKVVFLFFLRHPEGVMFKRLYEHKEELINLYKELSLREDILAMHRSIDELVDPTKNSINEKCSRIKEAFVKIMDDKYARHYYITGNRGSEKRILLDRSLVVWEYEPSVPKVIAKSEEDIAAIQNQEIDIINEAENFRLNGNRSKGLELLTGIVNANPYNTRALHLRAIIHYELQQHSLAITDYSRVIELNDLHSSAFFNRAIAYYVKNEFSKAIRDLTSCISLLQKSDRLLQRAHKLRADIYSNQNNKLAAIEDYKIAASLGCDESKQILQNS